MATVMLSRATLASARSRPELDFILPGLLAGSVGLIVGQGAVGKSFLALHIGLAVATGRRVAGGLWTPGGSGRVTLVFGEDQPALLQERLYWLREAERLGDDEAETIDESLTIFSGHGHDLRILAREGGRIVGGPFLPVLRELCVGQRLVILDPLAFLSDLDENDNSGMTRLMQVLQGVCRDTGTTIIVLRHVSKNGAGEREDWTVARGASALTTACRWQVNLSPPNKVERETFGIEDAMRGFWVKVALVKTNYGQPQEPGWVHRLQGGALGVVEMREARAASISSRRGGRRARQEAHDDDEW